MKVADLLLVLPGIPILILISASFTPVFTAIGIEGAYYITVFAIFALIGWSGTARLVRSEVLALKDSEFINAERVLGASQFRIILKHILPNALSTILIIYTLGIAGALQSVAVIAFLGFGSQSTLVWGQDLAEAIGDSSFYFGGVWWIVSSIVFTIFILSLGFNLLGDALRDALDPRLKE